MGKFILLVDFAVIDMEEDKDVSIIVDRPFIATGCTIIDVAAVELIMKMYDVSMVIKVFEPSEYLDDIMACLEDEQCEGSKCVGYFLFMVARRKKKKQKPRMKQADLSVTYTISTEDQAISQHSSTNLV